MAAPKGNRNAAKGSKCRNALEEALDQWARGDVQAGKALSAIAHNVVTAAVDGEQWAMEFIFDRIDGKAVQSMQIDHTHRNLTDAELESRLADLLGKAGTSASSGGEAQTLQ